MQLNRNHVLERVSLLKCTKHTPLTSSEKLEYEKIDRMVVSAFKYAHKRCGKLQCGTVPYSPELQSLAREGRMWDLVLKKRCGRKVSSSIIRRLTKKCKIECPLLYSRNGVSKKRNTARKKYAELKPKAKELRDQWLDRLADLISSSMGEDKAKFIRQLKTREEVRLSHRTIKNARTKWSCGGTA